MMSNGSKRVLTFAVALLLTRPAFSAEDAEQVTFAEDVAPIFMERCVDCHRPGEAAPMSLLGYKDARPWAKSIKKAVSSREMPPWFADPEHGEWANDTSLSDHEIATIVRWVDQGAPKGDLAKMPQAPTFTVGWQLGEPDYIIELPEVSVPAEGPDVFPTPMLPLDISERRWIRAVEVRPEDRSVNHHVVLFMTPGQATDQEGRFDVLSVWAAGTQPTVFPDGTGRWVSPGQILVGNQHYHPSGVAATDKTRVGLFFGEGEPESEISAIIAGVTDFSIPANASNHLLTATHTIERSANVVSYFPHMHMRGRDMAFVATYPDGRKETLLDVPAYDFDWQLFYYPEEPKYLPVGTEVEIIAHYDNSVDNPDNPDPNRDVGFGLQSTDEMMFGVFELIEVESAGAGGAE
ncbi:MAG: thiol-disulfide isomerase [Acidobacteriota bacterium]|nr:thiol-disulfide isomerase [Acidobacteriota bacterium]